MEGARALCEKVCGDSEPWSFDGDQPRTVANEIATLTAAIATLAKKTPGGGLYIEDLDCDGGLYSFNGFDVDAKGNLRIKASMREPNDLAKKTGYFRKDTECDAVSDTIYAKVTYVAWEGMDPMEVKINLPRYLIFGSEGRFSQDTILHGVGEYLGRTCIEVAFSEENI